jgi:hypothetical protein
MTTGLNPINGPSSFIRIVQTRLGRIQPHIQWMLKVFTRW